MPALRSLRVFSGWYFIDGFLGNCDFLSYVFTDALYDLFVSRIN